MRTLNGTPRGTFSFKPLTIGAGGFIVGLDATGLACVGDEGGAYYRSSLSNKWQQICNPTVLPSSDWGTNLINLAPAYNDGYTGSSGGAPGGHGIGVAPSNTSVIYHCWNSYIYKNSSGFTAQSTKLGGPFVTHTNLGAERYWGTKLIVDNQNANVFLMGCMGSSNSFTAKIDNGSGSAGNTLTVTSIAGVPNQIPLEVGMTIIVPGGTNCTITALGTGSGGTGTYTVSGPAQNIASNPSFAGNIGKVVGSTDGSTLFQIKFAAGALYSSNNTPSLVACDYSSSVVGSIRQKWAYSIYGDGVYQSTNGPNGTYSKLTAGTPPVNTVDLLYDGVGNLWAVDLAGALYKKTPAGNFASVTLPSFSCQGVAVDATGNKVFCTSNQGDSNYIYSTDSAATWLGASKFQPGFPTPNGTDFATTAIAWMGKLKGPGSGAYPGVVRFVGSAIYLSTGFGVCWLNPPASYTSDALVVFDDSLGIENTVPQNIIWPPNRYPIVALGDWGVMPILDFDRYTNPHHEPGKTPASGQGLMDCSAWHTDYAQNNVDFLVTSCCFAAQGIHHGTSTDCGKSWTAIAGNHPSGSITPGGVIIAQSTTNFIWKPSQNFRLAESTDAGNSWSYSATFPAGTGGETGFGYSQWNRDKGLCCDKTNADAYVYNYGPPGQTSLKGIWKKPLGGSWTQVFSGNPGSQAGGSWRTMLKCAPGKQGHLFWKTDTISPLWRSTDGGVTWSNFNVNLTICYAFGFGAAAPGFTYPAVYIWGIVSGSRGLYVSYDNGATLILISATPNGFIDDICDIEADTLNFMKFDSAGNPVSTLVLLTEGWGGLQGCYNYPHTLT